MKEPEVQPNQENTKIKKAKISELILDDKNFNKHNEFGMSLLEKSVGKFGMGRSILVDKNNKIIAGNGITETAGQLGIEDVEIIESDGSKLIAVRRNDIDLDTPEGREMALADNATGAANLAWDYDALSDQWSDDKLQEWGVGAWGEGQESGEEKEAEEDDFDPDVDDVPPITQPGDKWKLGHHFLLCGDSTRPEDLEKLMGNVRADLIVTDPPYNVNYKSKSNGKSIQNDNMDDDAFYAFLCDAFRCADARLREGGAVYVWHADGSGNAFRNAFNAVGWPVKQCLIWKKNHFVIGRQDYQWCHEPCLYSWKQGAAHYFISRRDLATVIEDATSLDLEKMKKEELKELLKKMLEGSIPTTVIDEKVPLKNDDHPTMKPVKLIGRLVQNSSRPGEVVLDMFGGSGTTMVAAEQLGRRCYMMELDPKYCDVIVARWEKLTGEQAIKL